MVLAKQLRIDIGLKELGLERFGIGRIIACFHAVGSFPEARDTFKR